MTADLLVLRAESRVGGETLLAIRSATQQGTKVRVQMGEQEVLVGAGAVGGLVLHERRSAATIEGLCMWLATRFCGIRVEAMLTLTATPSEPPRLEEASMPSKYLSRLTGRPS